MNSKPIYTIRFANRKIDNFLSILKKYEFQLLIDVRTFPFFELYPQYNRNTLDLFLVKNSIKYVFLGDNLGERPKSKSCYDADGEIGNEIQKKKNFFFSGVELLLTDYASILKCFFKQNPINF